MRLQRGVVLFLLTTSVALVACSSSTTAADRCADFQGTWNTSSVVYTASADPITTVDLSSLGAAITLTADDKCNYTGTANIPTITSGTVDINGSFTLGADKTLILNDATAIGAVINATYQYTLSGNTLTLVNPSTTFDFDGVGPNPSFPATLIITFLKQ